MNFKDISNNLHPYMKGYKFYQECASDSTKVMPKLLVSPYTEGSEEDNEWLNGFYDARFLMEL